MAVLPKQAVDDPLHEDSFPLFQAGKYPPPGRSTLKGYSRRTSEDKAMRRPRGELQKRCTDGTKTSRSSSSENSPSACHDAICRRISPSVISGVS